MRFCFFAFCYLVLANTKASETHIHPIKLGDSTAFFIKENAHQKHSKIAFINVHENESTSVDAYRLVDTLNQFPFFWLNQNCERRIKFNYKNVVYSIDPNRIFSAEGIKATIAYDTLQNKKAEKIAKVLADHILKAIHPFNWVLSLHNNTPDNYTINSYLEGGDEAENASDVFINPEMDVDDFVFTTNRTLFAKLKEKNINVILQDNMNCFDDGSLSVYYGRHQLAYANIEAEHGHLNEQVFMIKEVISIITNLK